MKCPDCGGLGHVFECCGCCGTDDENEPLCNRCQGVGTIMRSCVFLDMDGVMNSHAHLSKERKKPDGSLYDIADDDTWIEMIDPACVKRLNRIIEATGADVVISSSWRHAHEHAKIERLLKVHGFVGQVVGEIPSLLNSCRGLEIAAWLEEHPDVESYCILDDDADMAHLVDRLVRTEFSTGLLEAHADRAIELLKLKSDPAIRG